MICVRAITRRRMEFPGMREMVELKMGLIVLVYIHDFDFFLNTSYDMLNW